MNAATTPNGNGQNDLGVKAAAAVHAKTEEATSSEEEMEREIPAKSRNPKKFYVVVGDVHEFKNAKEAEAFLNSDEGPVTKDKDYVVVKGHKIERKQKVSLR